VKTRLGSYLLPSTQTPGADVDPLPFAVYQDGCLADVGVPAPLGMALGVGHIISKLRFLPTQLTLQRLLL